MRIRGFLNKDFYPPAPFVKALLISENLDLRRFIDLHIDTGASSTIILDKDVRYLKLDVKSLKKAERNIGGIGGSINTYTIDDAVIVFKTEEGKLHKKELTLLVGVHRLDKLEEDERKLLMRIPSLLGRDILRNFKLVYNEKSGDVHMES